jgi:hypothetical protein
MQAIVQIPLFLFMVSGMKRIFSQPNSPAWSKANVIRFCAFLFFMIAGFFVASCTHVDSILTSKNFLVRFYSPEQAFNNFLGYSLGLFMVLFVAAGFLASFFLVPTYFKRSKFVVLCKKGLIQKTAIFDDGATSLFALFIYVGMGGLFLSVYLLVMKPPLLNSLAAFLMLSSYVFTFAGFLEFFRLGRFRNNKIFIITALAGWWMFIPWVAALVGGANSNQQLLIASISPFFGVAQAAELLLGHQRVQVAMLIAPCVVAVLMWLLAYQEYVAVKKQVGQ